MKELLSGMITTILVLGAFAFIIGGLVSIPANAFDKQMTLACEKLGFVDWDIINGQKFCVDFDDNLHYVKITCDSDFLPKSCSAKLIKVGEVEGVLK